MAKSSIAKTSQQVYVVTTSQYLSAQNEIKALEAVRAKLLEQAKQLHLKAQQLTELSSKSNAITAKRLLLLQKREKQLRQQARNTAKELKVLQTILNHTKVVSDSTFTSNSLLKWVTNVLKQLLNVLQYVYKPARDYKPANSPIAATPANQLSAEQPIPQSSETPVKKSNDSTKEVMQRLGSSNQASALQSIPSATQAPVDKQSRSQSVSTNRVIATPLNVQPQPKRVTETKRENSELEQLKKFGWPEATKGMSTEEIVEFSKKVKQQDEKENKNRLGNAVKDSPLQRLRELGWVNATKGMAVEQVMQFYIKAQQEFADEKMKLQLLESAPSVPTSPRLGR